ncbi:MAG: cytochrome bc complex cytochrome b subunit [Gemmatimonadota bacterium]|nr:cytochrome bc complex cytochrome b subunit [Gemmatimonadota bacterium]MDH3477668.1 cytochrome bc complex cytochrome b subunit [Gemmatimonadota bacterium]MDH3569883.1 cytochrome bc complex cytochrome b subunit [Gemmatimonadota bacterium]MDH5548816.1 cytochrome bc complex cytochrome b subunit [Gemmatimonadota bacterium]
MIRLTLAALRRAIVGVWDDIKASTDASLLGMARFIGLLYGPIDRSLSIDQAWRKALRYRLAPHVGWRHALGSITYLLFVVLVITGVLLAIFYRPSVQEAYPSIQHIVSETPFGWLVRDLHHWSANLIVIVLLMHMARVFFEAAYKPPRETNWLIGILLLFVVLLFGGTGYLLPWDQWSYWTLTEVMTAIARFPLVGRRFAEAIMGDVIPSGATLSRFFALHVIVLPWIAFALLGYHFTLVRRRGIAPPMNVERERRRQRRSGRYSPDEQAKEGVPFYPNHLLRSFMVAVVTIAIAITLAILFPRGLADPADPYAVPGELVSTWVPVDVSLALIRLAGTWGFTLFTLLGVSLILVPLLDRGPARRLRERPVVAVLGLTFFIGYVALWIAGRAIGSVTPSESLGTGVVAEQVVPSPPSLAVPDGNRAEPVPAPEAQRERGVR